MKPWKRTRHHRTALTLPYNFRVVLALVIVLVLVLALVLSHHSRISTVLDTSPGCVTRFVNEIWRYSSPWQALLRVCREPAHTLIRSPERGYALVCYPTVYHSTSYATSGRVTLQCKSAWTVTGPIRAEIHRVLKLLCLHQTASIYIVVIPQTLGQWLSNVSCTLHTTSSICRKQSRHHLVDCFLTLLHTHSSLHHPTRRSHECRISRG